MDVLDSKLHTGSDWGFHEPHEEVLLLSALEIDAVVARSGVTQVINGLLGNGSFNFVLLFGMG